jgi:hypothetical protein
VGIKRRDGAKGQHGEGPEDGSAQDGLPLPHTKCQLGGEEGEDDVDDDLESEKEAGFERRDSQGDDCGEEGKRRGGRERNEYV